LVWKVDTRAAFNVVQNYFGVGSTPAVEGDLLLVQVGGTPKGGENAAFTELKGNGTGLVAFDKYTGRVKWKASDELASYASPVMATIDRRRLCLLFARGGLVGVEVKTGTVDFAFPWRSELEESANASNPVVVGNKVFLTECYSVGGALVEVKGTAARAVWTDKGKKRDKSLGCHWMTPIHVDGYLYGCTGRHKTEAELRCVELATGKVMWRKKDLTRCSLMLVDGHFVCLGEEGALKLLKVNPNRYEEVSSAELYPRDREGKVPADARPLLKEPCWAAPILSNGLMYLRGEDRLVCVELIPAKKR
jgi:outer membrane protein assembly factor BamB